MRESFIIGSITSLERESEMIDFVPNSEKECSMIDFVASLDEASSMVDFVTSLARESWIIVFDTTLMRELLTMHTIAGWTDEEDLFFFINDVNVFLLTPSWSRLSKLYMYKETDWWHLTFS